MRLIGVDTPETMDHRTMVQPFGLQAAEATRLLAEGVTVRLEFEGAQKDKDGRTLAYVVLPDGRLLNAELIRRGYAHAYTEFPFSRMEAFRALEVEARTASRGLWAVPTPVTPSLKATSVPPTVSHAVAPTAAQTSASPTAAARMLGSPGGNGLSDEDRNQVPP